MRISLPLPGDYQQPTTKTALLEQIKLFGKRVLEASAVGLRIHGKGNLGAKKKKKR